MLFTAVSSLLKTRAALQLENVALRHQIGVLQRSAKKRPRLNASDRFLWVWLSHVWTDWRAALVIVKPQTVVAWHRKAFRMFWTWKVRRGKMLTPLANCKSATAHKTTRTCCTPPLNSFLNSFWSFVVTSIRRAGRAIRPVCAKHFRLELFYWNLFKRSEA